MQNQGTRQTNAIIEYTSISITEKRMPHHARSRMQGRTRKNEMTGTEQSQLAQTTLSTKAKRQRETAQGSAEQKESLKTCSRYGLFSKLGVEEDRTMIVCSRLPIQYPFEFLL